MATYLLAIGAIFAILAGGLAVQALYRRFAARHPELGPFREEKNCGSCSAGSGCASPCAPPRQD
ncbi:MAG: hypothetical protein EFKGCFLK_01608 [Rhodocyclaceae bacterium]|nr:MAG: hypothetical protein F9K21_00165 [Rhodocyclaceae bacterium]MBE7421975.1 hypothetical protein [Zoogloeaceae bacterium]MBV6408038.1 hypothetical protein [Rhodocyclaceae bacterium]MCK6384264.1 hypothetical protein [Rhodocyclaceae bacterium]CAG0926815.1 hypothetical protein RHDC3_00172 [Rhodocyclaceae bacterium]